MTSTELVEIKASKKTHECSWCGETIEQGDSYTRYRWFDGSDATTVKMHPECLEASKRLIEIERGQIEFSPGDHTRGDI